MFEVARSQFLFDSAGNPPPELTYIGPIDREDLWARFRTRIHPQAMRAAAILRTGHDSADFPDPSRFKAANGRECEQETKSHRLNVGFGRKARCVAAPKGNSVRLTLPPLPRYEGIRTGIPSLDRATLNGLPS